jgi:hypothetical protein
MLQNWQKKEGSQNRGTATNYLFFMWVDYTTTNGKAWAKPSNHRIPNPPRVRNTVQAIVRQY